MDKKYIKLISTFFNVGNFPIAPGTMASAAGMLLYLLFYNNLFIYSLLLIVVTYLGFKTAGKMEKLVGKKDPGCIVIDEVSGIMIAFLAVPISIPVVLTGFFLFRAFDMFKIYPGNKFEAMGGAKGIMLDDIMAGVYTNLVMQLAINFAGGATKF